MTGHFLALLPGWCTRGRVIHFLFMRKPLSCCWCSQVRSAPRG